MLPQPYFTIAATVGTIFLVPLVLKKLLGFTLRTFFPKTEEPLIGDDWKEGVVYLYMFPRRWTRQMLNLSPFAIKLESWLRMRSIPYQVVETNKFSKHTKQIPYIKYNGQEVSDTYFIIPFLEDKFSLSRDEGLTKQQQGASRATIRMVDDCTSIINFVFRYKYLSKDFVLKYFRIYGINNFLLLKLLYKYAMPAMISVRAKASSVGRHEEADVSVLAEDDFRAISNYLGDNEFFNGSSPGLVDCTLFGHLSQIVYLDLAFPFKDVLNDECTNIVPYLDRFRDRIWPDWKNLVNDNPF